MVHCGVDVNQVEIGGSGRRRRLQSETKVKYKVTSTSKDGGKLAKTSTLPTKEKVLQQVAKAAGVGKDKLKGANPQAAAVKTAIKYTVKMLASAGKSGDDLEKALKDSNKMQASLKVCNQLACKDVHVLAPAVDVGGTTLQKKGVSASVSASSSKAVVNKKTTTKTAASSAGLTSENNQPAPPPPGVPPPPPSPSPIWTIVVVVIAALIVIGVAVIIKTDKGSMYWEPAAQAAKRGDTHKTAAIAEARRQREFEMVDVNREIQNMQDAHFEDLAVPAYTLVLGLSVDMLYLHCLRV